MLEEVNKIINKYDYIASYNGKGFDTHILESRFILNRISSRLAELNHIDLLYPCRAFFRRYLGSASLQDIERGILNYTRQDDIPGALIPYVYFDFLKSGNDEKIHAVIEHNRLDILSLAFIIKLLNTLMKNPSESPHELVSLSAANYLKTSVFRVKRKYILKILFKEGTMILYAKRRKKVCQCYLKEKISIKPLYFGKRKRMNSTLL